VTESDETSTPPAPAATSAPVAAASTSFEDQERAVGIDPDAPLPGEQGLRLILFGFVALFGIPTVLGGGIAAGYPVIGIVLAIALGAICLLFARPRNRA
jgi:hypothetical protein